MSVLLSLNGSLMYVDSSLRRSLHLNLLVVFLSMVFLRDFLKLFADWVWVVHLQIAENKPHEGKGKETSCEKWEAIDKSGVQKDAPFKSQAILALIDQWWENGATYHADAHQDKHDGHPTDSHVPAGFEPRRLRLVEHSSVDEPLCLKKLSKHTSCHHCDRCWVLEVLVVQDSRLV